ncbi:MAG: phytanoyl-CoA dioxygenase family protein [Acidiferrobacterales bacterium]|nr:phytanoyl-CoA dioxygenase family protein [Acidiferrobacterales bacterium]
MPLSAAQIQQFKIDGYLALPSLLDQNLLEQLRSLTAEHLAQKIKPFELETDVQYPGAPASKNAKGGDTIRRLRMAYQRHSSFKELAKKPEIINGIKQILGCESLYLNPNHHNCVMTKQPEFSSETLWHRDTRYWNFNNKYLINAWYALGDELEANGAMKIIPGSHRWDVPDEALDEAQFLIQDHPFNKDRLATQRLVKLKAGDALLFSAHCFHAAGKNTTDQAKFSAVLLIMAKERSQLKRLIPQATQQ